MVRGSRAQAAVRIGVSVRTVGRRRVMCVVGVGVVSGREGVWLGRVVRLVRDAGEGGEARARGRGDARHY